VGVGRIATLDGQSASTQLPEQVAAEVWARTPVSRVVSKKYLPTFTEAGWDQGTWSSGVIAGLGQFVINWLDDFTGSHGTAMHAVCWSRGTHTLHEFMNGSYATNARIQRRRRRGVGR